MARAITSLGFGTDIELRIREGADVTERDGYLVVRSPSMPLFRWGNFLLLREVPQEGTEALWTATFDREFPGTNYAALGVDVTDPDPPAQFAGFAAEVVEVMTAMDLTPPSHPNEAAEFRAVTTDADWEQSYRLTCACNPGADEFLRTRMSARRRLTEAGHGAWLGAFLDGELRAHLSIFGAGSSMARFQDVETHPDARRRGLAGTLVYTAARYAGLSLAARTLVMVADPGGDAIRLYRSLGFTTAERQLTLERFPRGGA
jgi:ribosomal protein S18 acetylase RimI-like enzyme